MNKKSIIPSSRTYTPVPLTEPVRDFPVLRSYKEVWQRSLKRLKKEQTLERLSILSAYLNKSIIEEPPKESKFFGLHYSSSVKVSIPKTIFVPYSHPSIIWALINACSLLYISTYGHYSTSFYGYKPNSAEATLEFIIDIVFVFDIFFNFNLAYFDHDNRLIVDRKMIFWQYVKRKFLIDCFTAFPFGFFIRNIDERDIPKRYLFRHFPKFIRWIGIRKKLKYLYFIKYFDHFALKHKHAYELIALSVLVMMGLHIIACLFFLSARYEDFSPETWVIKCSILDLNVSEQYLSSWYWAFMTLSSIGYGDIHPFTPMETQIAMMWMVVGVFFWSFTSSRFYITLENITNADRMIKQNLDFADDFAKLTMLPNTIKKKFKMCIKSKRIIIKKVSIDKFIDPHNLELRHLVAMDIYGRGLNHVKFFKNKKDTFIAYFAFKLQFQQLHRDELAWVKGCFADGIYFIIEGRLKLSYEGVMFMVVQEGDYVGDVEIFMKSERKFDCSSAMISRCFKMNLETIKELKIDYPTYYSELKDEFDGRLQHIMNELSMMYSLRLYFTKEISSFNQDIREDIKRRMYYKMFSENFYAMRNKKILELMHHSKELSLSVSRIRNIIRLLINMRKKKKK